MQDAIGVFGILERVIAAGSIGGGKKTSAQKRKKSL